MITSLLALDSRRVSLLSQSSPRLASSETLTVLQRGLDKANTSKVTDRVKVSLRYCRYSLSKLSLPLLSPYLPPQLLFLHSALYPSHLCISSTIILATRFHLFASTGRSAYGADRVQEPSTQLAENPEPGDRTHKRDLDLISQPHPSPPKRLSEDDVTHKPSVPSATGLRLKLRHSLTLYQHGWLDRERAVHPGYYGERDIGVLRDLE